MRKLFKYGGIIASIALIVAGAVSIGAGALGVMQVRDALSGEKIVGSPDMTPALISAEAKDAGLNVATLDIPSQAVAGRTIDTGSEAQAFAGYMRIHALEASGGEVYAEMGRFLQRTARRRTMRRSPPRTRRASRYQTRPGTCGSPRRRSRPRSTPRSLQSGSAYSRLRSVGRFSSRALASSPSRLAGRFARTRPRLRPQVSQSRECNQRRPSSQSRTAAGPGSAGPTAGSAFAIVLQ